MRAVGGVGRALCTARMYIFNSPNLAHPTVAIIRTPGRGLSLGTTHPTTHSGPIVGEHSSNPDLGLFKGTLSKVCGPLTSPPRPLHLEPWKPTSANYIMKNVKRQLASV